MQNPKNKLVKKFKSITFISIFLNIVVKNLRLVLRSRTSALIVLLGPLLITFLVGASFNTSSIYDIRIGTYSSQYTELTESLLTELTDKQFTVVKYDSEIECNNNLKSGNVHVCAVFPPGLSVGSENPVVFYVDNSRMNLVWVIIDAISSKVQVKSEQLSLQLTQVVLDALSDTRTKLVDKGSTVNELENKTLQNQIEIDTVAGSLASINFQINDAGVGDIRRELEKITSQPNFNSSTFDVLWDKVNLAENKSVDVFNELTSIAAIRDTSVTQLADLSTSIISDVAIINALESTINDVKQKIDAVAVTNAGTIVSPIKTQITPLSIEKTHLNFLFPTLVVLIIMFISVLLTSLLVVREKMSTAYFRNFITPTTDAFYIIGDYFTNLFIVLLQLLVIFLVGAYFFNGALDINGLLKAYVVIVLIITVFVLIGMLIGYLFRSEETSILAAISFASIALFFSSTILPLETLPTYIKDLAQFNPFVISEAILKSVLLFNAGFFDVAQGLGLLLFYVFILLIFIYLTRKITKYYHS